MKQTLREFTRNNIRNMDITIPKPIFGDLSIGEMFHYPATASRDNVYMKVHNDKAVYLPTGDIYADLVPGSPIVRVFTVSIDRN